MSRTVEADEWEVLCEFSIPSERHNEIKAVEKVVPILEDLGISEEQMERIKTAVAEAATNAIEHGNQYKSCLPTEVRVLANQKMLLISVADQGAGGPIPVLKKPDLEAKLEGEQSPRGWGFFLIRSMVDRLDLREEAGRNFIDMYVNRI